MEVCELDKHPQLISGDQMYTGASLRVNGKVTVSRGLNVNKGRKVYSCDTLH